MEPRVTVQLTLEQYDNLMRILVSKDKTAVDPIANIAQVCYNGTMVQQKLLCRRVWLLHRGMGNPHSSCPAFFICLIVPIIPLFLWDDKSFVKYFHAWRRPVFSEKSSRRSNKAVVE